jgi:uncharacterized protein (DUF1778 family)
MASSAGSLKSDRLDMRLSRAHKALIEKAAAASGQPVASFAVVALVQHAHAVLKQQGATQLSARDARRLLQILERTEPNRKLRLAARRFRTRRG